VSLTLSETATMSEVNFGYAVDVKIPSDPAEARIIQEAIEEALKSHRYCERDIFGIRLALEEALVNAIKHGNQLDRAKQVRIAYKVAADRFDVLVGDEGPGFDPNDLPDPTAVENLERTCGRGVMLMRHYMTVVDYRDCGNTVCMSKIRNGAK
jgi:serine/threonine-protein kinase RsbW